MSTTKFEEGFITCLVLYQLERDRRVLSERT